ncbi:MAG: methionine synthase, partial [Spirochaetia bacterium]|nr:methionine synthase [Spirochaetia bacterium]
MTRGQYLRTLVENNKKVLLLDGAMGTTVQALNLREEDYQLDSNEVALGCIDLLSLTRSDVIFDIHYQYLLAGSDIIETNTFGANAFSLEEYKLTEYVYDLNLASAEIARSAVEMIESEDESRYAFVAGVLGPTGKGLSFSTSTDDLSARNATFDQFVAIYTEQVKALLDGNVDLFLVETVFDTLVAKAALYAIFEEMKERNINLPVMVSATFSDKSGRTLSGQTLGALVSSLSSYPLLSLGLNCSTGIEEMLPLIESLSKISPFPISAHPNAGFPDIDGTYRQSGKQLAHLMKKPLEQGLLNIIGGCCGSTHHHIRSLKELLDTMPLPSRVPKEATFSLSGLELIKETKENLIIVGERANVSGSRKFKRLIAEKKYNEALSIIKQQVLDGSHIIDICLDDALLDGQEVMKVLLRALLADPEIARIPIMIDSSNWNIIVTALKELQGRAIVNSISLKDGPELFIEKARFIQSMGAAMVVMLFDEEGQADTFKRKCEIATRSYNLLIDNSITPPHSIIFDPNILTIATGMEESATYGKDFLEATRWIKTQYTKVKVSGGLSNLSFSFRSNSYIREAIHAVFLEQGLLYGLDMAIVNPSTLIDVKELNKEHYTIIKEALLLTNNNGQKATEDLINLAIATQDIKKRVNTSQIEAIETLTSEQRLVRAIVKGDESSLKEDLDSLTSLEAVEIIEGPLMEGMKSVG